MSNKSLLAMRRLVAGQCQACGNQFFYRRTGRPRNFCDQKCRQSDFRRSGYAYPKIDKSVQKNEVNSRTFDPDFGDRPLHIVAGPKLSPSALRAASVGATGVIEANNRRNAEHWRDCYVQPWRYAEAGVLIGPPGPPINLDGVGYDFPEQFDDEMESAL
jgi:endogenous inhibitor of DNA gyrase (YacG/DUF329 family)